MLSDQRKKLGAFYTPAPLADVLVRKAIDRVGMRVLEPSFGGGSLLDALARHSTASALALRVTGIDIDNRAVAARKSDGQLDHETLRKADFLELAPKPEFDAVVANPPFTRNHELCNDYKAKLRADPRFRGVIKGAAGLWAYFIIQSALYLKPGGSLAFILPGAFEFATYAKHVREFLCEKFLSVEIFSVAGKIEWEGSAEERAVVLVASGYERGSCMAARNASISLEGQFAGQPGCPTELPQLDHQYLGAIADVEIGIVTGANKFFLFDRDRQKECGLPDTAMVQTISKARHVKGMSLNRLELSELAAQGEPTLLLHPPELGPRFGNIRKTFAQLSKRDRSGTHWFKKRKPWWKVQLGRQADAVFTYMNHLGPRICLIENGITATNTLHRIRFRTRESAVHRGWCVSMLTSYTQMHAEKVGRRYGGGVIKFELGDTRRMPLVPPLTAVSEAAFRRIDTAIRSGASMKAMQMADEIILKPYLGSSFESQRRDYMSALRTLRDLRGVSWGE